MTSSFKVFWEFYYRILKSFKADYWTLNCGLDAYLYLLFQRKLLKLMIFFFVLSMLVSVPTNIFQSSNTEQWFEQTSLSNKNLTVFTCWIHTMLITIFTMAVLRMVFSMKNEARKIFSKILLNRSHTKNTDWLKGRTVHVRGLLPHDRRGKLPHHLTPIIQLNS